MLFKYLVIYTTFRFLKQIAIIIILCARVIICAAELKFIT